MTYIEYLNAFNSWVESNPLPGNAQLMFFKFLNVFNRAGWPEYVRVDTLRLMSMIDVSDKRAAFRARDKLVEAGLIQYQRGHKGSPNVYALCEVFPTESSLYGAFSGTKNATINGTESGTINGTESGTINGTHIKNKKKTKTKKEPPIAPLDGFECGAQLKSALEDWLAYKQERGQGYKPRGLKTLLAEVKANAEKYGEDAVIECIRRSMSSNWQGLFFDRLSREAPKTEQPYRYDYGEMGDSL